MALPQSADANLAFVLTPGLKQQVSRVLDALIEGIPQSTSVLIDRAGRIVDVARKPVGVDLQSISALAAGCFATTHELATAMEEDEYSLLFQHENDQQVYIWPVVDRALLVILLGGARWVPTVEERVQGDLGQSLISAIKAAAEPPRVVPAPKIAPVEIPDEVRERMRALTAIIMDLQAKQPQDFNAAVNRYLLASRDELIRALGKREWRIAAEICERTRRWMIVKMNLPQNLEVGQVLTDLYGEVFASLNGILSGLIPADRMKNLYTTFFQLLNRKYQRLYFSERFIGALGIDVVAMWTGVRPAYPDTMQLAGEFVPAMDMVVRELVRSVYLARGPEGRQEVLKKITAIYEKHRMRLMPFGLEGVAGRDWTLISFN